MAKLLFKVIGRSARDSFDCKKLGVGWVAQGFPIAFQFCQMWGGKLRKRGSIG
jgi:hypothetical protein